MDVVRRVAANIRRIRQAQGLSQEELADRAGLHRTYVSQVERAIKNATIVSLAKIAGALQVEMAELVSAPASDSPGSEPRKPRKGGGSDPGCP